MKSCDKFGNMNDDYIDKHVLSLSHLPIYAPSWSGRELLNTPRTSTWAAVVKTCKTVLCQIGGSLPFKKKSLNFLIKYSSTIFRFLCIWLV